MHYIHYFSAEAELFIINQGRCYCIFQLGGGGCGGCGGVGDRQRVLLSSIEETFEFIFFASLLFL